MHLKIFLIILLAIPQILLGQTKDLEERVKKIQLFEKDLELQEKKLNVLVEEVSVYKNPKTVVTEQLQLDQIKLRLKEVQQEVQWTKSSLGVTHLTKKIDEIKNFESQINDYEKKKKTLKEVEAAVGHTKRLDAYIEKIKQGKYNLATIILHSLNSKEREIAADYEKLHLDVLRNQNLPDDLKKDIAEKRRQIVDSLTPLEGQIEECKMKIPQIDEQKIIFEKLKSDQSLDQVKISLYNNDLGYFDCKEQATYIMPNHLPGVLLLKNNNTLSSAIKLDSSTANGYQAMGVKGSYNEKRLLCRLDPICDEHLKKSEEFYKRDEFFPEIKNDLVSGTIENLYKNLAGNQKNPLTIFQEMNKLGFYSIEELSSMVKPFIEYAKTLEGGSNPKDYLSLISAKIDEAQKKMQEDVAKRAKSNTDKQKRIDSENVVKYVFLSQLKSGMESLLKSSFIDYPIQDKAYEACALPEPKRIDFCQSSTAWRERLKLFDSYTEIKNLNSANCNEAIFRFPSKVGDGKIQCAPEGAVDHLIEDVKKIEEKIK